MTSITSGFPSPAPSEQVFMFVFYNPPMTLLISCFRGVHEEFLRWGRGWDKSAKSLSRVIALPQLRRSPLGSSANVVKRFHFCRTTYSLSGGQTVNEVHINVQKANVNVLPVDCLLIHQKKPRGNLQVVKSLHLIGDKPDYPQTIPRRFHSKSRTRNRNGQYLPIPISINAQWSKLPAEVNRLYLFMAICPLLA